MRAHVVGMCRVMECPQLQSMSRSDRSDCAVALMDGDHARVERIRAKPRKSCHVCDAMHDLRVCLWLHGMPDAMREDLLSAYKRLKIHEKDRILQHWVEIRRYALSAAPVQALSGLPVGLASSDSLMHACAPVKALSVFCY